MEELVLRAARRSQVIHMQTIGFGGAGQLVTHRRRVDYVTTNFFPLHKVQHPPR